MKLVVMTQSGNFLGYVFNIEIHLTVGKERLAAAIDNLVKHTDELIKISVVTNENNCIGSVPDIDFSIIDNIALINKINSIVRLHRKRKTLALPKVYNG